MAFEIDANTFIVVLVIILGAAIFLVKIPESKTAVEEDIQCDVSTPCPDGQDCYKFENKDYPICFKGDPCSACASRKCMVLESYPMQIKCQ